MRDIVFIQYLADFLKNVQKSFHCSFEVVCSMFTISPASTFIFFPVNRSTCSKEDSMV